MKLNKIQIKIFVGLYQFRFYSFECVFSRYFISNHYTFSHSLSLARSLPRLGTSSSSSLSSFLMRRGGRSTIAISSSTKATLIYTRCFVVCRGKFYFFFSSSLSPSLSSVKCTEKISLVSPVYSRWCHWFSEIFRSHFDQIMSHLTTEAIDRRNPLH